MRTKARQPRTFGSMRPPTTSATEDTRTPPTRLTCDEIDFEVWISVDGKDVPYYSREYNPTKREVSCWIESESGKPFSINYRKTTDKYGVDATTFLDGHLSSQYTLTSTSYYNKTVNLNKLRTSASELRYLTFGEPDLTDEEDCLQNLRSEHYGEIRIVIDRLASYQEINRPVAMYEKKRKVVGKDKIYERSNKGITHQIKLGETERVPAPIGGFKYYYTKRAGVPVTFSFRYRDLAKLQAMGLIPLTPSQTPSTSQETSQTASSSSSVKLKREVSEEQFDREENDINERERALLAELEEIRQKKRSMASGASSRKKIKLESETPKFYFKPGEIIDLTI